MSYAQIIYNRLRQHGLSEAGALGLIGNFDCESNCEPYRLQNDNSSYRTISKAYVNALNSGQLGRLAFAMDSKGFGIAQWTYSQRKLELYDEWKKSGKAIDDPVFQTDFAVMELKRDFTNDYKMLCTTFDIQQAVVAVCYRFENPAIKNTGARFAAATRIKSEIELNSWENGDETPGESEKEPASQPGSEYCPPRMLCVGMSGPDVEVLQSMLKAMAIISQNADGVFGSFLKEKVIEFQKIAFPDTPSEWDGVVGPKTWAALIKLYFKLKE